MGYHENVFINCPFDDEYVPLFRALVFTVQVCGFVPRSALELDDGSEARIGKIVRIISESRFGVHDLSRTELDAASQLPRFNMPLELGLFLGAKFYGAGLHQAKAAIIFDRDRYRYQAFCSDLAGQDVRPHNGGEADLIQAVRNALTTWCPSRPMPGGKAIHTRYVRFVRALPRLAARTQQRLQELTFNDLIRIIDLWLVDELC